MAEGVQDTEALEKIIRRAAALLNPDRHIKGYLRNPYQLNPVLVLLNALQLIEQGNPEDFKKLDLRGGA